MDRQMQKWKGFGLLLRKLREKSGLGLREFAQKVALSPTYISRVETGKIPPPTERRLRVMAKLLDVPQDDLLTAAGKVDSDVLAYIRKVESLPAFLRAARAAGKGAAYFEDLARKLR